MVKPVASSLLKPHLDNLEYQLRPGEKIHSKRVGKIPNHTRNEWRRYKITLVSSGEQGMVNLVWTSMNIDSYLENAWSELGKLEQLVRSANDIIENR
jgi:hypothetical protein